MDEKKKILMLEIEHWRRSKLLPEQYCDFLMNLYLENPNDKPSASLLGMSPTAIQNSNWKIWMLYSFILAIFSLTALNFNSFDFPMQMGVSVALLTVLYGVSAWKRGKAPLVSYVLFGAASLFLLFIGIYLIKEQGYESPMIIVMYVMICGFIWMISGLIASMAIFQLCGWVTLVFSYGWLIHHRLEDIGWVAVQLSWVPLGLVFVWIGWLIHQKSKQTGAVFLLVGCLVWYMPELYGLFFAKQIGEQLLQTSLMGKIIIQGIVLFALRKKWTEWVA